jgi:hypothetical protein
LVERPRVSDYAEHHKKRAEEQYRTVEALPRRKIYKRQVEYGNYQDNSQFSGIDSEEECYGDNWYSK